MLFFDISFGVSLDLKKNHFCLFVCLWVEIAAMEDKQLGVMRVYVKRGINLAIRDSTTSDPYVVVTLANQVSAF